MIALLALSVFAVTASAKPPSVSSPPLSLRGQPQIATTPAKPSTFRDDFNRADGALGPNWTVDPDPAWLGVLSISRKQVVSTLGHGGASYWNGHVLGADQYSQIRLTGVIRDWTGVIVRGSASPTQSYNVAIKIDGAHLYSFLGGTFFELGHDATSWATGDILRLEVRTVAPNTARLTVYRNGRQLFTHDDPDHFIAVGQPGIALYASTATAFDDWEGGEVAASPKLTLTPISTPVPSPAAAPVPVGSTVTFTWDLNAASDDVVSYSLWEFVEGNYLLKVSVPVPPATITGLTNGAHAFAVTATDKKNRRSDYSSPPLAVNVSNATPTPTPTSSEHRLEADTTPARIR